MKSFGWHFACRSLFRGFGYSDNIVCNLKNSVLIACFLRIEKSSMVIWNDTTLRWTAYCVRQCTVRGSSERQVTPGPSDCGLPLVLHPSAITFRSADPTTLPLSRAYSRRFATCAVRGIIRHLKFLSCNTWIDKRLRFKSFALAMRKFYFIFCKFFDE